MINESGSVDEKATRWPGSQEATGKYWSSWRRKGQQGAGSRENMVTKAGQLVKHMDLTDPAFKAGQLVKHTADKAKSVIS